MSARRREARFQPGDAGDTRKPETAGQRTPSELASSDPELRGLWESETDVQEPRGRGFTQNMIGVSPRMQRIFKLIEKVAPTENTVLITGESGTGKEMVATSIHLQSRRASKPFIAVNAAAIAEGLFESELFGHVRGAFTGAVASRPGLFQQADGGTLFLDEVAEMPLAVQAKVLRALQNGEVRPVGGGDAIHVDARVIAATNRDLTRALAEGKLREDLYYRLSVFTIEIPPLRERREDIPVLASYFRQKYARRLGKRVERFTERAQYFLVRYDYPGNVRELENGIERAVTLAEHGEITHMDLPPAFREAPVRLLREGDAFPYRAEMSLTELEAEHIRRALIHHARNTTRAAKSLGISRSTLWRKMKQYSL